ncbi:MAG: MFS transporter [Alphaproteobacteria bacterium]|nr:MFS transporter [Alphaproteobacteria bacterium]
MINDTNRKWWILAAMGGSLGLVVLDETIVGVALPTIRQDLAMTVVASHWIISAYLVVFTGLAAASGKTGDMVDIRSFFVAGVMIFGFSSMACGFAQNGAWLITARAIQGIGAAIIFPTSVAMLTKVFPPEQRGLAFGIHVACGGTFMALGPLAGGFMIDVLSWRWIFWINLPVAAAVVVIVWTGWAGATRATGAARFDYAGLVTLVFGLVAIVLGLMQGGDWGWSAPATLAALVGGTVLLAAFVAIEARKSAPLIEVRLFRNATFSGANLAIFAGQFGQIAVVVFIAIYLQHVLGMSPLNAGLALLPGVLALPFAPIVAGRLSDRFGARRPVLVGGFLFALSLFGIAFAVSAESYGLLVVPLIVWGCTMPMLYVPTRRAVMATVPASEHGEAGGINLNCPIARRHHRHGGLRHAVYDDWRLSRPLPDLGRPRDGGLGHRLVHHRAPCRRPARRIVEFPARQPVSHCEGLPASDLGFQFARAVSIPPPGNARRARRHNARRVC